MTLAKPPCQERGKPIDHRLPVERGHVGPRLPPYLVQRLWCTRKLHGCVNKGLWLSIGDKYASFAMLYVHVCRGIVIGDHHQAAGHSFQGDVAKCFRFAGEEKHICRGIMPGELLTGAYATEDEVRMGFLQGSTQRPVSDHDKLHRGSTLLHNAVRCDSEPQVFLCCNSSHVEHDEIVLRYTPRTP